MFIGAAALTAAPMTPSLAQQSTESAKSELSRVNDQIKRARTEHEKLRQKAEQVSKDILSVRKKMVTTAQSVQEQEESLNRLEQKLSELENRQNAMKERLSLRDRQRVSVLAALQNLAWKPTEALLAQPLSPEDTLRSALLLREAVPRLEYSTEGLKKDLTLVASLTTAIRAQYASIRKTARQLDEKRREMDGLIKKKSQLQTMFSDESKREKAKADALAKQAGDLKELLARLEAESRRRAKRREENMQTGAFTAAKGHIPYPVKGNVTKKYGEMTDTGIRSKGITITTRANAQVVSPHDGRVLFAGPFRGYGELLIIEHADGYHTLLAGMDRLDTTPGQSLLAGEPVGVMKNAEKPSLYVELRQNGQTVDPLLWLGTKKG